MVWRHLVAVMWNGCTIASIVGVRKFYVRRRIHSMHHYADIHRCEFTTIDDPPAANSRASNHPHPQRTSIEALAFFS